MRRSLYACCLAGVQGPEGKWVHKVVIKQEWPKMIGWTLPTLPPLITDILISLDDKYLYFSNWYTSSFLVMQIRSPGESDPLCRCILPM